MRSSIAFMIAIVLFQCLLSGCTDSSGEIESLPNTINESIADEKNNDNEHNSKYTYNFDITDIQNIEQLKSLEDITDSINDVGDSVELRNITHTVNSAEYYYTTKCLVDNFYSISPETQIENREIVSNEVLVMVNIDYENKTDEAIKYYLNSFHLVGITSQDNYEWLDVSPRYQDKVEYPEENNSSYFRIYIKPNSTYQGTIGFFINEDILDTKNIYLRMSEDGSSGHHNYIKLPQLVEGTEKE